MAEFILRGDCESTDPPMLAGTAPDASSVTWARSNEQAHAGTYGYKFAKTNGPTGAAYVGFDIGPNENLKGLTAGNTYTLSVWIYLPASQWDGTKISLTFGDYAGSWQATQQYGAATYGSWQQISVTRTVRATATGVYTRLTADANASLDWGYSFYVDDVSCIDYVGGGGSVVPQIMMHYARLRK
jgi:hypothetical protein